MHTLNYIIWNGSPEIFTIGFVTLRWYGLLWAVGFLLSQQVLYYIFRKEGKPQSDVETLTIYMVVSTLLGARLGHVIFYQPEMIWEDPLGIFLPFQFSPEFHFTGYTGLASHGAAIGILTGLYLYSRKKNPGQNYLQILDRIVIVVCLTGALIRFGNFFNSEILGKPTDSAVGIVFINPITEAINGYSKQSDNMITDITVKKDLEKPMIADGRVPIKIFISFKEGITEAQANGFVVNNVKPILRNYPFTEYVDDSPTFYIPETMIDTTSGQVITRVNTYGIARHPAQLYEGITCILLMLFLLGIWWKYKNNLPEGRIFGYFMIILWSLRFAYEYLKEVQVSFEEELPLDMGQILSIPLVIVGILILIRSYKRPQPVA